MPNWCNNVLAVKGQRADLQEFSRYVKHANGELHFIETIAKPAWACEKNMNDKNDTIFPSSEQIQEYSGELLDWCWWSVKHLGTKWSVDVYNAEISEDRESMVFSFDTAWLPPLPIVAEIIKVFSNLKFELSYKEPSWAFFGTLAGSGGEIKTNEAFDLTPESHPEYWTWDCDDCREEYVHDGRECPHCRYVEHASDA
jgi:hypothetical protein